MRRTAFVAALLLASMSARADSWLPFGRDWAGDAKLPRPYGVSIDAFAMHQDYEIQSLSFTLPGVTLPDPGAIDVENRLNHQDLKFDAWVLPFLNVFGFVGHVNARTLVDLRTAQAPVPLGILPVKYSGEVFGGGLTLAYGGEHWLAAVTGSYADSRLEGDFDSSVHSTIFQPRVGWVQGPWVFWGGAMFLDVSEHHEGRIVLGPLGSVPFDVVLSEASHWNPTAGLRYSFGEAAEISLEFGAGHRDTTLLNFGFRFE
jgi:hypothetical protein